MTGDAALYVYGLIANTGPEPDSLTLGDGVGGAAVTRLDDAGLTALVSPIVAGLVPQTRRNMLGHTAVLERAMTHATVLPVRFGTVAPGAAALRSCIAANLGSFRSALADIAGRVELGVKASWRQGVVFAEIVAGDPDLCRLRDRLHSRPASETYYERVELGRRVEAALVERREAESARINAELAPLAERDVALRVLEEDMIFNRAFLVRRENEALFDLRMQALAERCAERVDFRYVGPVPPYNFVRLQAGWLGGAA
jgi:hypothetical protein